MATSAGEISYQLARSYRRRTIEISVEDSAEVRVSAPKYSTDKEIEDFIHEKAQWIKEKLKEARFNHQRLNSRKYEDGHHFLFLGTKYRLNIAQEDVKTCRIKFDGQQWLVNVPRTILDDAKEQVVKKALTKWYRGQAKEIFGGRVFHYSRVMQREPKKITVKTQKRIWGSCDHRRQAINLNWYLILAPIEVIDYVVVHELCHFDVPNHSQRFWKKVEKVLPDYKQRQRWLKTHALDMVLP